MNTKSETFYALRNKKDRSQFLHQDCWEESCSYNVGYLFPKTTSDLNEAYTDHNYSPLVFMLAEYAERFDNWYEVVEVTREVTTIDVVKPLTEFTK